MFVCVPNERRLFVMWRWKCFFRLGSVEDYFMSLVVIAHSWRTSPRAHRHALITSLMTLCERIKLWSSSQISLLPSFCLSHHPLPVTPLTLPLHWPASFPHWFLNVFCDVQLMLHRSLPIECSAPCLTSYIYIWPWSTKPVTSNTAIFVEIANKTLYCIDFSIMSKIIMILCKDHVPWRYFVNVLLQIYKYLIFDY